jgi:FLVCR family MFS transporter 7
MTNEKEYQVYGYRWVILLLYALVSTIMQVMWTTFFSITLDAGAYYGFATEAEQTFAISLFSIIFMVGMIVFSIPSMAVFEKFGYKKSVGFGAALMAAGAVLRGVFGDNYTMVLAATVIFAVAQPFILNAVGLVAGKWFPANERALANGLGLLPTIVGMMLGLIVIPVMLGSGLTIKGMLMVLGVVSAAGAVIFVAFTKEAPPTPPCAPEESKRSSFAEGFKALLKKRNFMLALLAYFILLGVFNVFFTLIEPVLKAFGGEKITSVEVGIIGVIVLVLGTIGSFVIPLVSDKSPGRRRLPFVLIGILGGGIGLTCVMFSHSLATLAISAGLYGLLCVGAAPVMMTYSAEVSYPTSEGTSEGMLLLAGNISGALFLVAAGVFGNNYTLLMTAFSVLMALGLVIMLFCKEKTV